MEFLTHSTDGQGPDASGRKGLFQRACSPIPPPAALLGALLLAALVFLHAFGNGKNGLAAAGAVGADAGDTGPFASLTLEAQSAYVYDLATETVLFERYPERRMALASLAKLMTALAAQRLLDQDAQVRISVHAISAQGDDGLLVGERFRAKDVLDIMLVRSSNDAALALAEAGARILGELPAGADAAASTTQLYTSTGTQTQKADSDATVPFIRFMNAEAQRLGLRETEFFNSTGLDVSEDLSGAYGSAKDVVALGAAFLREAPEQFSATRRTALSVASIDGFLHKLENTNDLLYDIPGLIAAKTGFSRNQ